MGAKGIIVNDLHAIADSQALKRASQITIINSTVPDHRVGKGGRPDFTHLIGNGDTTQPVTVLEGFIVNANHRKTFHFGGNSQLQNAIILCVGNPSFPHIKIKDNAIIIVRNIRRTPHLHVWHIILEPLGNILVISIDNGRCGSFTEGPLFNLLNAIANDKRIQSSTP